MTYAEKVSANGKDAQLAREPTLPHSLAPPNEAGNSAKAAVAIK